MIDETAPAQTPAGAREIPVEFHGNGGEYFRIWIVNLLLTIVTLGIYSAWAKVRRLRYFYGSTSLAGSSFEYHGQPIAILKGRLIVVGFYGLFLGLQYVWPVTQFAIIPLVIFGLPWVVVRSRLFQMRMTSWRGLRFNFHGRYGGAFAAYIGWTLLALVTLMLLWPFALYKQVRYLLGNTAFGTQRFAFTTTTWPFYRIFLGMLGLMLLGGIGAALVMILIGGGFSIFTQAGGAPAAALLGGVAGVAMIVCLMLVFALAGAYYRAQFLNVSVGGVEVGPHRLRSRLETLPLTGILITNLLGMVLTLGLFYPWAQVRLVRYQLSRTSVLAEGDLGQFVAGAQTGPGALGEEAGDFFDVDFGI